MMLVFHTNPSLVLNLISYWMFLQTNKIVTLRKTTISNKLRKILHPPKSTVSIVFGLIELIVFFSIDEMESAINK